MQKGEDKFAQVVIPSPLKEPLTYAIPPLLTGALKIGMRVSVPLGQRKVTGVVVDTLSETSLQQVREIVAILDERPILDHSLLQLIRWVSQYYLAPLGEVLTTILPPSLRTEGQRFLYCRPGEFPIGRGIERKIFEEVKKKGGRTNLKSLARGFPGGGLYRALNRLVAMGAVEIRERPVKGGGKKIAEPPRDREEPSHISDRPSLTPEQQGAFDVIQERIGKGGFETFLLYGVTGSGKTEVYLRAVTAVRKAHKRSLVLLPEISLTPQLLDRVQERFPGKVGVLHSALTASERWAQWWQILAGDVDVVVGARSAVFAPAPDLGLIVVDEEHDTSYKQEDGLRYHARDLAVVRGKLMGCPVILGSATPSIESFENCRQGRYRLIELSQRVEQRALPPVEVVDLRQELRGEGRETRSKGTDVGRGALPFSFFSPRLREALQENLARGYQSLLFLNRRGFANFLQCRLCGFVLRCAHCSVSMTFHLSQRVVYCHHCGSRRPASDCCPECGKLTLSGIGFGTEQIEQELHRMLSGARITRMDRDTTSKRGSQERLIRQWGRGEIDVLVGTQMITKGHDVTGVTLVGAILADLSLNLPDFRAVERTFQLLSQVAGRAGRGNEPGRVIIQTYAPDHYAFPHVISHDYKGFFASEIEFRRALNYPPFSRLVHLRLEGSRPEEVEAKAKRLGEELRIRRQQNAVFQEKIEILGPAPAPITKLRGRYRWQILLKGKSGMSLLEFAGQARAILPRSRSARLYIDVDPYNML
ncbi:MAG: primosomal protein N' [Deltaproteobacteria bacterium]|nr:primosomal protein N' [Deltaproteobacteria bacterium]